jgi:carbon monoxide dehydrogenase subunit G
MRAPRDRVWAALADLGSHDQWMRDAESIVFLTEQREGVGTRMEVKTVVGPLRTLDKMEVVGWDEGRSIEVVHTGLITGRGTLTADEADGGALVSWEETLTFPWYLGGPIAAFFAKPVLGAIWRGNLERLEETISSP